MLKLATCAILTGASLAAAFAPAARADGSVTIALTPDGQQLASDLGLDPAELQARLETRLAEAYDTANVDGFLERFADATSFASRGVGVDYAPLFHGGELGFTANLAASVRGLDAEDDPAAGVAPNLALMGGLNLEHWGHPNLALYAHGMYRSAALDDFDGSIASGGVHVQYHLFYPTAKASTLLFLWSGLHLTAGVEYSRWTFGLERTLTQAFDVDGTSASSTITADATGRFELESSSLTFPVELTTSARIAYFAGVYAGFGLDLQLGNSRAEAALQGHLTGTDPQGGAPVDVGTATIALSGERGPTSLAYHILLGVEANLWRIKLFTQATFIPVDGASVALGLRLRL